MRTLIIADGGREQLADWAGGYRHLIDLEGEPLLHRTVRQFTQWSEVYVLGPYEVEGAVTKQPERAPEWLGIEMFAKCLPHLGMHGTTIVFGDVWFSDAAAESIRGFTARDNWNWQVFGRPKPSQFTGTRWGEYFAFVLPARHYDNFVIAMNTALKAHKDGFHRVSPWEVYFAMEGLPIKRIKYPIRTGPHWTTIDDWTDDFDFIEDVTRWRDRREASRTGS